jgi:hypothetical protein
VGQAGTAARATDLVEGTWWPMAESGQPSLPASAWQAILRPPKLRLTMAGQRPPLPVRRLHSPAHQDDQGGGPSPAHSGMDSTTLTRTTERSYATLQALLWHSTAICKLSWTGARKRQYGHSRQMKYSPEVGVQRRVGWYRSRGSRSGNHLGQHQTLPEGLVTTKGPSQARRANRALKVEARTAEPG